MPRRAAALTALLQKHLLVHEPYVACAPQCSREVSSRRFLEHAPVSANRVWVGKVLVENRGGIGLGKSRRSRPRMSQAPVVRLFGHAQRRRIDPISQTDHAVGPKSFAIRCEISFNHDTTFSNFSRVACRTSADRRGREPTAARLL